MSMNYVTFNQDHSHLAVGTTRGFRVFTTDPFSSVSESKHGDVALVEMLFSTSLIALLLSPRRLHIMNTKRQSNICELTFPTTVLAVRLNRLRLVVVLEDQIYLYDIRNMKLLHTIDTSPNPNAICALASSSENCFLAYPNPQKAAPTHFSPPSHAPPGGTHIPPTSGDVLLFDAQNLVPVNIVTAHKTPLSYITINNTGTLLATASEKGTIIRVFSIPKADKLYQFRRGSVPSRIFSMSFNTTSSLLCVSSASETVHIFKLGGAQRRASIDRTPPSSPRSSARRDDSLSPAPSDPHAEGSSANASPRKSTDTGIPTAQRKHDGTFMGMIRRTSQNVGSSLATSVGAYLPSAVAEMWEPARDFAWCKIPKESGAVASSGASGNGTNGQSTPPLRSVVAMSGNSPQVMVVTNEGKFYVFGIDLEKGGECTLVKSYEVGSENERLRAGQSDE